MRNVFRFSLSVELLLLACCADEKFRCLDCDEKFLRERVAWRYAREGEFPWMVSLQHADASTLRHFCGGSIAAENVVLTACHCLVIHSVFSLDEKPFLTETSSKVVVAGSTNNNRSDPNHFRVVVGISRFIIHPRCQHFNHQNTDDRGGWDYDFGLVILKKNLTLDGVNLAVFRLLAWNEFALKRDLERRMARHIECVATGWGKRLVRDPNGTLHDRAAPDSRVYWPQLTVLQVRLDDFASCYNIMCTFDKKYCNVDHWGRSQMCATSESQMEVCYGDSGGPLMCGSDYFLYGLVGWGPSCGEYKVPSVYPTIYNGLDFIMQHLGKKPDRDMGLRIVTIQGDASPKRPSVHVLALYFLAMNMK